MTVFDVHPVAENFLLFVIQHDAQYLVIDHPLRLFRRAPQQFFHFQNRTRFARHFIQQQQRIRLCPHFLKQPRILNRHRQPAGQQRQNVLLVTRKVIQVPALHVQHADAFPLQHQRHSQLGAHAVNRVDVARVFRRVAHAHGVPRGRSRPGDPLPQGDSQIIRKFARIADRKAVTDVTSVPFDHQHAENLVVNVPLDQRRRPRQNLVQIQRSVHFFADFRQCREDFRGHFRPAIQCRRCSLCVCGIHVVQLL